MQLTKRFLQRGDTLVEVTIALAILSMTLMGATRLAIRAFQQGQTARARTALSLTAQQQLEHLRNFRDTHSWSEFLHGDVSNTFEGVLSAHTGGTCKATGCFVMGQNGNGFAPVDGSTSNPTVNGSYLEIHATVVGPQMVKFTASWGFPNLAGGPDATSHVVTQLTDLTAVLPTPVPAPTAPVVVNPNSPCVGDYKINLVPDAWIGQMREPLILADMITFQHDYWTMIPNGPDTLAQVLAEVPPSKDFAQSLILPAGNYRLMFMTYDDHTVDPALGGTASDSGYDTTSGQMTQEQLKMTLFRDGVSALTTGLSSDIPFNGNTGTYTELATPFTVNGTQKLTNIRVTMVTRNAGDIKATESDEGLVPMCAGFTKL